MKKQIVIAGGGFAGLYAAKYLDKTIARHADVEVVLISDQNFTLFRIGKKLVNMAKLHDRA